MSDTAQGPGWWQASDQKWYPPQPAQPPPFTAPPAKKRGRGCLFAFLGAGAAVVLLVVIIAVLAAAGGDDSKDTATVTTSKPASGGTFAISQTASTSGFEVMVFAFHDPQASGQFLKPAAGMHYASVDVQLTNRNSDQKTFSSLLGYHLLDSKNQQYDVELTDITPKAPDGEFAPGQSLRGLVVFEIPDGTAGLKLRVQGSLTAAGAVFALN